MSLQPHVDRYAIRAFEKQLHAYDVVGDRGWDVDLDAGTIVFDDELEMRVGSVLSAQSRQQFVVALTTLRSAGHRLDANVAAEAR